MTKFLIFAALLVGHFSFGQSIKKIEIPFYQNSQNGNDTTSYYKLTLDIIKQTQLPDLELSQDSFHFRYWSDIHALDIWTNDFINYFGLVTNYAKKYNPKLLKKGKFVIEKIISNQYNLNSIVSRQIYKLVDTLKLCKIPTDSKIKGWTDGLDGEVFIFENSSKTNYALKTYWTPRVFQDTLNEAKRIQYFIDRLNDEFKIRDYYNKLKLPIGNYQRNGIPGINIETKYNGNGVNSILDIL